MKNGLINSLLVLTHLMDPRGGSMGMPKFFSDNRLIVYQSYRTWSADHKYVVKIEN